VSFGADLAAFAQKSGESLDRIIRQTTIELGNRIIDATPVDEGRAQGNWQTTTGSPAVGEVDRVGPVGAMAELKQNVGGVGTVTYITNNLPYIMRLEEGLSKKQSPPYAMVRKNIENVEQTMAELARRNKV